MIRTCTAILVLLSALAGAAESGRPVALPGSAMSVTAPAGWTAQVDASGGALVLTGPASRLSLISAAPLVGEDLDAAARRCRDDLSRLLPDFAEVASDATLLGGQSWRVLTYRFAIAQRTVEQRQYLARIGGELVVATLDGDPVAKPVVEAVLTALGSRPPRLAP
jgi:hypothetical protein